MNYHNTKHDSNVSYEFKQLFVQSVAFVVFRPFHVDCFRSILPKIHDKDQKRCSLKQETIFRPKSNHLSEGNCRLRLLKRTFRKRLKNASKHHCIFSSQFLSPKYRSKYHRNVQFGCSKLGPITPRVKTKIPRNSLFI